MAMKLSASISNTLSYFSNQIETYSTNPILEYRSSSLESALEIDY